MKKGIAVLIMSCLVLAGCGGSSKESGSDELVLESNQQIKYGQVTKINGNELTVAWANQVSSSDMSSMKGGKRQNSTSDANASDNTNATDNANATTGSNTQGNNASGQSSNDQNLNNQSAGGQNSQNQSSGDQNAPSGDAPSGDMGGGTPPSGDATSGDMGGGTPPDMNGGASSDASSNSSGNKGNAQSSGGSSDKSSSSQGSSDKSSSNKGNSSKQQNKTMYQLTGESDTITIPVGTKVTTSLGATTTFSRIAANDTLKLLMQTNDAGEQVVVGVWIVA